MSGLKKQKYPRQLSGIKTFTILDEMVLYAPDSETAFSLNHSAKAIWDLCDGKHTVQDICEELGKIFDRSSTKLLSDVEETLRQFNELGMLEAD